MFDLALDILVNVTDSEPYIILIIATERKIVFWLHRYLRFGKLGYFNGNTLIYGHITC